MNNIFEWAKKELSQDAVIAWLLNEKDQYSKLFINELLSRDINGRKISSYTPIAITSIDGVWAQGHLMGDEESSSPAPNKIDVFASFMVGDEKHALIIEDKVYSGMHSHQLIKYISGLLNNKKKNTYDYVHFCMVKTGPYYFWQRDYYQREIVIINDFPVKLTTLDEPSTKKRDELKTDVEIIQNYKNNSLIDYHSFLLQDYATFFQQIKTSKPVPWLPEYSYYLVKLKQKNNHSWMEDLNNNSILFFSRIIPSQYADLIGSCDIALPDGGGKRKYEFKIYGIHGKNLNKTAAPKERYVLLIYTSLQEEMVHLCMNLHLFTDENSIDGYSSEPECKPKALKHKAIDIIKQYNNDVFEINTKSNAELKLITPKEINILNNGSLDWSEYKQYLSHLLMIANKIKNEFDKSI